MKIKYNKIYKFFNLKPNINTKDIQIFEPIPIEKTINNDDLKDYLYYKDEDKALIFYSVNRNLGENEIIPFNDLLKKIRDKYDKSSLLILIDETENKVNCLLGFTNNYDSKLHFSEFEIKKSENLQFNYAEDFKKRLSLLFDFFPLYEKDNVFNVYLIVPEKYENNIIEIINSFSSSYKKTFNPKVLNEEEIISLFEEVSIVETRSNKTKRIFYNISLFALFTIFLVGSFYFVLSFSNNYFQENYGTNNLNKIILKEKEIDSKIEEQESKIKENNKLNQKVFYDYK